MNDGYGSFAYYYDALNVEADYEKRAEFFHFLLKKEGVCDGILLDLACGTGAMSELFAKMGYDVIGIDASEDMLAVANEKKIQSGDDILYLRQDMRKLDLFGTVDCCICALDGVNHLTNEDDLLRAFLNVALFTRPGGVFVFDANTPYKHENVLGNNSFVYDIDGLFCVWQNTYMPETQSTQITLDIFERCDEDESDEDDFGETYIRIHEAFEERAYPAKVLASLLERSGFERVEFFSEFGEEEPGETIERMTVSAVRSNLPSKDIFKAIQRLNTSGRKS